jgi:hypothetical protein
MRYKYYIQNVVLRPSVYMDVIDYVQLITGCMLQYGTVLYTHITTPTSADS